MATNTPFTGRFISDFPCFVSLHSMLARGLRKGFTFLLILLLLVFSSGVFAFVWPLSSPTITQIYACRYDDADSCADLPGERYRSGVNVHAGVDMGPPLPRPTAVNQRVEVATRYVSVSENGGVNVRSEPAGPAFPSQQPPCSMGNIIEGPVSKALDGVSYKWWKVDFDSGEDGWVADAVLGQVYGVPVKAAADGVVHKKIGYADRDSHGMGNVVILRHGTTAPYKYSLYAHLDNFDSSPAVNQPIGQGVKLGEMGRSTTKACDASMGAHLHFEIKESGTSGNASNDGPYWGYTPGHPDLYGYFDPRTLINAITVEPISPTSYRNSGTTSVDIRAIPGTSYPHYSGNANELVIGKLGAAQKVVATKRASVDGLWWYFLDLPSRNSVYNGKHGGWISGSSVVQELSAEQRQVASSGDG